MAIELETSTLVVSKQERTKQIVISTPKGEEPMLEIHRERVTSSDGKVLGKEPAGIVTRSLSEVADQIFVVSDMKLTGSQIAGILASVADQLRRDDISSAEVAAAKAAAAEAVSKL